MLHWMSVGALGFEGCGGGGDVNTVWVFFASPTPDGTVGFMLFTSMGNGIRFGNQGDRFEAGLVQAAHTLALRWSPVVGMIRCA